MMMTIQLDADKVKVLRGFLVYEDLKEIGVKNIGLVSREAAKTAFILSDVAIKVWDADRKKSKKVKITIVQALCLIEWLRSCENHIYQTDFFKLNYTRELIRDLDEYITNYRS